MKTPKRSLPMFLFGSTIGSTKYPMYLSEDNSPHPLPRPFADCKPFMLQDSFYDSQWFYDFVHDIELIVYQFLYIEYPNRMKAKYVLDCMALSKSIIPDCLRIKGTSFTQMAMVGRLEKKGNVLPVHVDKYDVITALIHFGNVNEGGSTDYYDGCNRKHGKLSKSVSFEHGRVQIGFFNEIPHGASHWKGERGIINLNLKLNVLQHFQKYGDKYYKKYREMGYPKKYTGN